MQELQAQLCPSCGPSRTPAAMLDLCCGSVAGADRGADNLQPETAAWRRQLNRARDSPGLWAFRIKVHTLALNVCKDNSWRNQRLTEVLLNSFITIFCAFVLSKMHNFESFDPALLFRVLNTTHNLQLRYKWVKNIFPYSELNNPWICLSFRHIYLLYMLY